MDTLALIVGFFTGFYCLCSEKRQSRFSVGELLFLF